MLGEEAAKRKVKAYVRIQHPFYETPTKPQDESQDVKPIGVVGTWWHETLRALGAIEGYVFRSCGPAALIELHSVDSTSSFCD